MPGDYQKARTYAAEWRWRAGEHERKEIRSLDAARSLLARKLLPPLVFDRTVVKELVRHNTSDAGWMDSIGHGHYEIGLRIPTYPSVVVHEAAHILIQLTRGAEIHGPEFRATYLWLIRQTHGLHAARRLGHAFAKENLTW